MKQARQQLIRFSPPRQSVRLASRGDAASASRPRRRELHLQKLHDIVRLMVFVAIMASVLGIRYLLVIAQKDLNQGGQEIEAYKTTREGVLGELL
ncbi:hypothetical protein CMV_027870 [Castanea mollissima]|uniref:Uncharacterized protein n=1 Tax=Castanea mollissima TaxID=60419 RepID=A0A8J4QEM6_9ROSI|nr:hypothetical protein CMV_027870 [Castanea mollissima]